MSSDYWDTFRRIAREIIGSQLVAWRDEIARVIARCIARGDLRPDADPEIATELLVGPVYFRLMFGGELTLDFANRAVDNVPRGHGVPEREFAKPQKSARRKGRVSG
jgi:hypothetical protein